ncbi:MAG: DUF1553 domain-containing protein [Planctomycetes bacterium]|nr:DUF1553 domain-containing protein [Planctomycetota bacterium]
MPNSSTKLPSNLAKYYFFCLIVATCTHNLYASENGMFDTRIKPILQQKCYSCHSHESKKNKGGLVLDSLAGMLEGGDSGAAIIIGKPEKSKLVEAISHTNQEFKMPPNGKLSDQEIRNISEWIKNGAVWPAGTEKSAKRSPGKITQEDRKWWAFQPVKKTPVPTSGGSWAINNIDHFISEKHSQNKLIPAPEADKRILARRLYFDLTGLPPTPSEIDSFINDQSSNAYESLVDHLLNSQHYGERSARFWLDLVRYAESDGYRLDEYRPQAWLYRDYVVKSFNADKPYDLFIKEQIAGDELFPDDPDALIATGYLRHWIYEYNQRDVRTQWNIILDDLTDTTSDVFMGMGLQCARCHDHKFDPILQKDYFRLRAFFSGVLPLENIDVGTAEEKSAFQNKLKVWEEKTQSLRKEISDIEYPFIRSAEESAITKFPMDIQAMIRKKPSERTTLEHQLAELSYRQALYEFQRIETYIKKENKEKYLALKKQLSAYDNLKPQPLPRPLVVKDVGPIAAETTIPKKSNANIEPGFLTILDDKPAIITPPANGLKSSGRRSTLANWIADKNNPLTARVMVNRIWQQHFGKGLASNASDFGKLGEAPSHPELLDWLAAYFTENNFSMKKLHRLIVTSATYRQSSNHPNMDANRLIDPENKQLWHCTIKRLDAEQIRDAIYATTGEIKLQAGGPGTSSADARRSIYTKIIRNNRDPLLDVFDAPYWFSSASSRQVTTTPVQSLLLINSPLMLARARAFAERLNKEEPDLKKRIDLAYKLAFGRTPNPEETNISSSFLELQAKRIDPKKTTSPSATFASGKIPFRDGQAAEINLTSPISLAVPHSDLFPTSNFTIETFALPKSIAETGAVRTLVANRSPDIKKAGWSFGITGKQSRRKPQTLVLQVIGKKMNGEIGEEAIFSDQHIALNKPYYISCAFTPATKTAKGLATFFLKDLSNDDEPLLVSKVEHSIQGEFTNNLPLTIGSVYGTNNGNFDGLIDDIRLSNTALGVDQLLFTREGLGKQTIGYWQFESKPDVFRDASDNHLNIRISGNTSTIKSDSQNNAWIDLCQILLNSSEFLYVE